MASKHSVWGWTLAKGGAQAEDGRAGTDTEKHLRQLCSALWARSSLSPPASAGSRARYPHAGAKEAEACDQ